MHLSAYPALLLNADYQPVSFYPLKTLNWHDSVKAALSCDVTVVEEYNRIIRSPGKRGKGVFEMRLPSVVALKHYRKDQRVAFTRIGIALRDRFKCSYCGDKLTMRTLTFDHVVPQSKGGHTDWKNVVAACGDCNTKKGDKMLARSGLSLKQPPFAPTRSQLNERARQFPANLPRLHSTWLDYLGISLNEFQARTRVTSTQSEECGGRIFPPDMTSEDYWNVPLEVE
jgi:5-methylcytosine-specific restriction endonuclease McrA